MVFFLAFILFWGWHTFTLIVIKYTHLEHIHFYIYFRPDPNFIFATRTLPELFFKIFEFRVFPSRLFPSRLLQTIYNHPQILLFSSRPDTKSSVPKSKCLRYKRWIQGKSGKFDNWFMMHFDLFQSRQSNPRFIHVEAIKSINQDGDKLLSNEAHAL